MKRIVLYLIILITISNAAYAQYDANWESLDKRETPTWYKNAKFGIFIHWGLYSVPSWATKSGADGFGSGYSEWYWQRLNTPKLKIHQEFVNFQNRVYGPNFKYQDFANHFKAELFNPDEWADILQNSGAKYIVLTSKHHEGYALWPSAQAWNWNSVDTGPHRDLAGDLAKSVKAKGLKMGFYYSLYEWYNPNYLSNVDAYVNDHMLPQMKDLVTRYKPDILWADGEWEHSAETWRSTEFLSWLFNNKEVGDGIIVNDRWGNNTKGKHGSFNTTEYGQGTSSSDKPWEECRGIGASFGYNRNENLADYMSSAKLIHTLVDIVSKGGNFLLNIGPTADGRIPVIMQQRLSDLGNWLKINGEAIYESEAWKDAPSDSNQKVSYTKKGINLYAICTEWPEKLEIRNLNKPSKITLLGYSGPIDSKYFKDGVFITAPKLTPNSIPCQHAWVFKIENALNN